ncbi:MAG: hypothetical protein KVP17_001217 [Porospora cf. gigantea B]|nr:MAG: hypothetical protein KVP17_001217 [Porospora cf. gigantea B]
MEQLLLRKWNATSSLQFKVYELQEKVAERDARLKRLSGLKGGKRRSVHAGDLPGPVPNLNFNPHLGQPVNAVAVHEDFGILITGGADGVIKLWDSNRQPPALLHTLRGHAEHVTAVTLAPSGRFLASAGFDGKVLLWDLHVEPGSSVEALWAISSGPHSLSTLTFSADGSEILGGGRDGDIIVWSTDAGRLKGQFGHHRGAWVRAVAVPAQGGALYASSDDAGLVCLCSRSYAGSSQVVAVGKGHTHVVEDVLFAPNDVISGLGKMVSPSPAGFKPRWGPKAPLIAGCVLVSASRDRTIKVWDGFKGTCIKTLQGHDNWVKSLAFAPNALLVSSGDDLSIRVWDVVAGSCLRLISPAHRGFVVKCCTSSDGIISVGLEGTLRRWGWDSADSTVVCVQPSLHSPSSSACGASPIRSPVGEEVDEATLLLRMQSAHSGPDARWGKKNTKPATIVAKKTSDLSLSREVSREVTKKASGLSSGLSGSLKTASQSPFVSPSSSPPDSRRSSKLSLCRSERQSLSAKSSVLESMRSVGGSSLGETALKKASSLQSTTNLSQTPKTKEGQLEPLPSAENEPRADAPVAIKTRKLKPHVDSPSLTRTAVKTSRKEPKDALKGSPEVKVSARRTSVRVDGKTDLTTVSGRMRVAKESLKREEKTARKTKA